jgi:hypothetical protein
MRGYFICRMNANEAQICQRLIGERAANQTSILMNHTSTFYTLFIVGGGL